MWLLYYRFRLVPSHRIPSFAPSFLGVTIVISVYQPYSIHKELCSVAVLFECKILIRIFVPKTLWPESVSELYRPSDRRMSAKLVPTFVDNRCHVVSVADPYGRILGF
jgi:hypothetical protein